jgi:hypothetical protein
MALPRNNARTGGPRTANGVVLASQNSLKTGVYSTRVLYPGDDADAFEALLDDLLADFRPRNGVERAVVQDVAELMWKKQRIDSIEQHKLRESFQKLADALNLDAIFEGQEYPVVLPAYLWDGLKLSTRQLAGYREMIPQIEKFLEQRSLARYSYEVPPDSLLFAELDVMAMETGQTGAELLAHGRTSSAPLYNKLDDVLDTLLEKARSYLCIASRRAHLSNSLMKDWTPIMRTEFQEDKNRRALDAVNRALYRTLAELRKLQSWRLYVDVQEIEDLRAIKDA